MPKRCAGELATLMANGDYIPVGFNAKLYGKECERAQPVQMEPFFAKFLNSEKQ